MNEKLRLLLATFVNFQVIRDDYIAKKPEEFAVFHTISLNKNIFSGKRNVEKTNEYIVEETSRLVNGYFQIDCIAKTQKKAQEMADNLLEAIVYVKRNNLIRNGYSLDSENITIVDRTFLEGSQYVYRFGFDIEISWKEINQRNRYLINEIKTEIKEK